MLSFLTLMDQTPFTTVAVSDLMTHLNITDSAQTPYLQSLIYTAVDYCERETGLDWRPTTWSLVMDQFPIWRNYGWYDKWGNQTFAYPWSAEFAIGRTSQRWQQIDLERGPLTAVTGIKYYDVTNTQQTLATDQYITNKPSFFPAILEPTYYWPIAYPRPDAVSITFTTGFANLPPRGQHAIKLLCGKWWVERESLMYGPGTAYRGTGEAIDCLLGTFKIGNYQ